MAYFHGSSHAMAYNDAFADLLGAAHPGAWGRSATVVLPEIWPRPRLADVLGEVFAGGTPSRADGDMLGLDRRKDPAGIGAHLVGSYSAVRDGNGSILGVLAVAVESASGGRRVGDVVDLVTSLSKAVTVDEVAVAALTHAVAALGCEKATVCLGRDTQRGWRVARRRRADSWDEAAARLPLVWSSLPEQARSPEVDVARAGQRLVRDSGRRVILPMTGPGAPGSVGYFFVGRAPAPQLAVLKACALLVADAFARAMHRESQRGAVEMLQRTAPQVLPSVRGVTLSGRYQPMTTPAGGGGDFYDGFSLPDGRLVVTVGDVMGRGVAAVAVMGQVRAALRGAAMSNPDPGAVFAAVDDLVATMDVSWPGLAPSGDGLPYAGVAGFAGELFATSLIAILDPESGELQLASAGHVPPVIVRRRIDPGGGGRPAELAGLEPGPPLGIPGDRPVLRLRLAEGDALVAFTDGLLDPRRRSHSHGVELMLGTLGAMAASRPRAICQHLMDELVGPEGLEDDAALVVLVRDSGVHQVASVLVSPRAGAVRGARLWVRHQLESWGLGEEITADVVMGVSELVTNVVLHAGTPALVSLELAGRLLVTVEDTGDRGAPRRGANGSHGDPRGRGLALVEAVSAAMGHERGADGSTVWFEVELGRSRR